MEKKYEFILREEAHYSVSRQCAVLGVSRSGYYQWRSRELSRRKQENQALGERSQVLFEKYRGRYGSPRMTRVLQSEGYQCSRNRIAKIMRAQGLVARPRRRFVVTTVSNHRLASPNLLDRCFSFEHPNMAWTSDITYVATQQGWLYVASVMDLCTRKIVGLAMREDMSQQLVIDALEQALKRQRPTQGLLVHSDRGIQYSSEAYRDLLHRHGIRQSMSRKGNCWDNAPMESFFKTMKVELVYQTKYQTHREAQQSIFEYIEVFYNRQRMHSALNFQTPEAFEALRSQLTLPRDKSPV